MYVSSDSTPRLLLLASLLHHLIESSVDRDRSSQAKKTGAKPQLAGAKPQLAKLKIKPTTSGASYSDSDPPDSDSD